LYKNVIIEHKNPNKNVRIVFMERFILKKLLSWKNSPYRKLLILKGVCQVGKVKLRIRFSMNNLKLDDVLNIPLFMAGQADQLIGLALEKMEQ